MARHKTQKASPKKKLLKLDLGCGQNKKEGFTGVDIWKGEGVDIVHDLEKFPWPFKDESVEEIHSSHYIEHTSDLIAFMQECYRILIPEGKMTIYAPYYSSVRCWQDPTHKRAISEMTFLYYNQGWRDANRLDHYGIRTDFDFSYSYVLNQEWASRSADAQQFAIKHYINVVDDIIVSLTKKPKDES